MLKYFIKIQIVSQSKNKKERIILTKKNRFILLVVDRVIRHGPVTFQSFTFTPHLLQRTIDMRHICFSNMPYETNHILLYIDTVSMPYKKIHFEYYQNDKQTIVVEYNEDIGKINIWILKNFLFFFFYSKIFLRFLQMFEIILNVMDYP